MAKGRKYPSRARKYDPREELTPVVEAMEAAFKAGEPLPTMRSFIREDGPAVGSLYKFRRECPDLDARLKAIGVVGEQKKTFEVMLVEAQQDGSLSEIVESDGSLRPNLGIDVKNAALLLFAKNKHFAQLIKELPRNVVERNEAIRNAYFTENEDGKLVWIGDEKVLAQVIKADETALKVIDTFSKLVTKETHTVTDATIRTEESDPISSMSDEELEERLRERNIAHTGRGVVIDAWVRDLN